MPATRYPFPTNSQVVDPYTMRLTHSTAFEQSEDQKIPVQASDLTTSLTQWIQDISELLPELGLCKDYQLNMVTNAGKSMGFAIVRFADPRMKDLVGLGTEEVTAVGCPRKSNGQLLDDKVHDGYSLSKEQTDSLASLYRQYAEESPIGPMGIDNVIFGPVYNRKTRARLSDHKLELSFSSTEEEWDSEAKEYKITHPKPTEEELAYFARYVNSTLSPLSTVNNFPRVAVGRRGVITADFHPSTLDAHTARSLYARWEATIPGNPKKFKCYCSHAHN